MCLSGAALFTTGLNCVYGTPYMTGTSEWEIVTITGVIANAGSGINSPNVQLGLDNLHSLDFYAPMVVMLPNSVPTNEQYEIVANLPFYTDACIVGRMCNMEGAWIRTAATLTYTMIASETCQEQSATATGAATTGVASASPGLSLGSTKLSWSAWVSATNTVSVRVCNPSAGAITPATVSWNLSVMP